MSLGGFVSLADGDTVGIYVRQNAGTSVNLNFYIATLSLAKVR